MENSFFMIGMLVVIFFILYTVIIAQRKKEDETDRNRSLSKDNRESMEQNRDMTVEEVDQLLTDSDREEVRKMKLDQTLVIAVKYVRDHANCSLKSAKDYVDQFEEKKETVILTEKEDLHTPSYYEQGLENLQYFTAEDLKQMVLLKNKGKIVNAIQIVRDKSGWGLREAKEFIDHLYTGDYEELPNSSKTSIEKIREGSHVSDRQIAAIVFAQAKHLKEKGSIGEAEKIIANYTGWNEQECKLFVEDI